MTYQTTLGNVSASTFSMTDRGLLQVFDSREVMFTFSLKGAVVHSVCSGVPPDAAPDVIDGLRASSGAFSLVGPDSLGPGYGRVVRGLSAHGRTRPPTILADH